MSSKLKPCPFCGGEAETELCGKGKWAHWCVWCNCGVLLQDHKTEAEAIKAWNTRAERTCKNTQTDLDFMCSECGKCVDNGRVIGVNYCPNCGAKVVDE